LIGFHPTLIQPDTNATTTMLLADRRIALDARPAPARPAPLEVVMLGHCPPEGPARWDRVARDEPMLAEIAALGFTGEVARLRAWQRGTSLPAPQPGLSDDELRALQHLPLPIRSLGHYQTLFPQAFSAPTAQASRLAGNTAWLPWAVQDFFDGNEPGYEETRTLWVLRVPESAGVAGFLPQVRPDLAAPAGLGAFDRALAVPRAGLLLLPDLERLQVPARLPDVPRLRLPNPEPVFLPLGSASDDGHRERRLATEMPTADVSPDLAASLAPIARTLARRRPDLMCLMSVPFAVQAAGELPAPAAPWLALAQQAAGLGDALRQVQWLYPYLRGPGRPLVSASGMVAGLQARVAQRFGPWRSAAARALPAGALPWPPASAQQAAAWRAAGLSVLVQRNGRAMLDDEALPVPVLPSADLANMPRAQRARADWRSAEVQRFMGWLRRELQALGERLLFDVDAQDPRPEQALRHFFTQLHAAGALRGARPEQAFRIQAVAAGDSAESTLAFEIELAPAFPIDLIRISFVHDRADGTARVDARLDGDTGHG